MRDPVEIVLLICGLILMAATRSPVAAAQVSTPLPWLHVAGANIVDEQGNVFVPRGAAIQELSFSGKPALAPDDYMSGVAGYGGNSVRLAVNSAFWLNGSGYKNGFTARDYQASVDSMVNSAQQNGIYLIIDLHNTMEQPQDYNDAQVYRDMLEPAQVLAFWEDLGPRYANRSNILYSLLGQPLHEQRYFNGTNDLLWWNAALAEMEAVRKFNQKALFIVPSLDANVIRQFYVQNPWPIPNVVYALHRYYAFDLPTGSGPGEPYAELYASGNLTAAKTEMEKDFLSYGLNLTLHGKAVNLIEFGATITIYEKPVPNWDAQVSDLYSILAKYGVGWEQWVYYEKLPAWPGNANWSLTVGGTELSPQGQLWSVNLNPQGNSRTLTTLESTTSESEQTSTASHTSLTSTQPTAPIPGFPWEAIAAGLFIGLVLLGRRVKARSKALQEN